VCVDEYRVTHGRIRIDSVQQHGLPMDPLSYRRITQSVHFSQVTCKLTRRNVYIWIKLEGNAPLESHEQELRESVLSN
jgi:hypothetical protein